MFLVPSLLSPNAVPLFISPFSYCYSSFPLFFLLMLFLRSTPLYYCVFLFPLFSITVCSSFLSFILQCVPLSSLSPTAFPAFHSPFSDILFSAIHLSFPSLFDPPYLSPFLQLFVPLFIFLFFNYLFLFLLPILPLLSLPFLFLSHSNCFPVSYFLSRFPIVC